MGTLSLMGGCGKGRLSRGSLDIIEGVSCQVVFSAPWFA
jgi:hypothetical protein